MSKLTDTHLNILGEASEAGLVSRPASMKPTAAVKVATKLVDLGLVREVLAKGDMPVWRTDNQSRAISLKILKAGRTAVRIAEAKKAHADPMDTKARTSTEAPPEAMSTGDPVSSGSKRSMILALMRRREGATIEELIAATGWLPHTTRAALSGLRKKGAIVVRDRDPARQVSVYRIELQTLDAAA